MEMVGQGQAPGPPEESAVTYQFAHLGTYSRRGNRVPMKHKKGRVSEGGRSVRDIYFEAAREAGSAPHVETPQPPNIIFNALGKPLADHVQEIERRISERNKTLKKQKLQSIRSDTHVLDTMVFSHPFYTLPAPEGYKGEAQKSLSDPDAFVQYSNWLMDTIEWAQNNARLRGVEIMAIVEHVDESHPHLHVLSLPVSDIRMNAKNTHPGYRAKFAAIDSGEIPKIAQKRFRDAMSAWQDDYYEHVGIKHGLTRFGPKRQRLSRQEWQARKAEAKRVALNMDLIRQKNASAENNLTDAIFRKNQADKLSARYIKEIAITESLQLELNGRVEALGAWVKGQLEFSSEGRANFHEKAFRDEDGEARKQRITSQSVWIYSELMNLDRRVKKQIRKNIDDELSKAVEHVKTELQEVFIIAAQAWARGVLLGNNENANDGKHHFVFGNADQDEVADIEAKLQNFSKEIAEFLESLPDRNQIADIERLAKVLGPSLSKEMNAQASSFRTKLSGLWRGKQG